MALFHKETENKYVTSGMHTYFCKHVYKNMHIMNELIKIFMYIV